MRNAKVAALSLLAALLAVPALQATTAVERTEAEMIQEAQVIVTGRCIATQSQWVDRDLVTLATIQVGEVLKGGAGSQVTVVLPGGADSNRKFPIAMSYPAAPEIFPQEQVLLFLISEDRVADGYAVVGFSQGKLTVVDTPQGKVASQNLSALNLQGRDGSVRRGGAKTLSIDALRTKIQEIDRAGKER